MSTLLRAVVHVWCPLRGTPCCLRQPAWLHGTRCFDTALVHRLQMPFVSSRGYDGNSPATPTARLRVCPFGHWHHVLYLAMPVRLAGGTTWALPPSAGKCTRHAVGVGQARQRAERTRATASEHFGHACPLVRVSAHQKKAAPSGAPGTCCRCNRCAIRAPKWRMLN